MKELEVNKSCAGGVILEQDWQQLRGFVRSTPTDVMKDDYVLGIYAGRGFVVESKAIVLAVHLC
jgi:hypothetical protein